MLYPTPTDGGVELVLLNVATGAVRNSLSVFDRTSQPVNCDGDLCAIATTGEYHYMMRFDAESGIARFELLEPESQTDTFPSSGLLVSSKGGKESLYTVSDNKLTMQVEMKAVIPDGFTIARRPLYFADEKVYLLPVEKVLPDGGESTQPGTDNLLVAIDATSGKKLWETPGATTACLPSLQVIMTRNVALRCQWAADTTVDAAGQVSKPPAMQGFDARTGKTLWSVELRRGTVRGPSMAWWVGEDQIVVTTETGEQTINVHTGKSTPAGRRICSKQMIVENYLRGVMLDWCAGGSPVAAAGPWPSWAGAQSGDVRVVFTEGGLKGYQQPPATG